ncbi:MAG: hypothetical protein ABL986_00325 [Vicinamibacterales bacterium]
MQGSSNRSVVIISGLITLLVLGSATLAVAFRNGWVHVASAAPRPDVVTALAQPTDADVTQSEVAAYRGQLEEAYRALDDAYAQVRSLQAAQSQLASGGDEDRHERRSRHRESDDD